MITLRHEAVAAHLLMINIATVLDRWSRALLSQSAHVQHDERAVADSHTAGRFRTARAGV